MCGKLSNDDFHLLFPRIYVGVRFGILENEYTAGGALKNFNKATYRAIVCRLQRQVCAELL